MILSHNFFKFLWLSLVQVLIYLTAVYVTYQVLDQFTIFNGDRLRTIGLILETGILSVMGFLVVILTKRFYLSLVLTILVYLSFVLLNLEKINFLYVPLFPNDFAYLNELILAWDVFKVYIPKILLTLTGFIYLLYVLLKFERKNIALKKYSIYLLTPIILATCIVAYDKKGVKNYLRTLEVSFGRAHAVSSAERFGLLFNFTKDIIYVSKVNKPSDYSADSINNILSTTNNAFTLTDDENEVNLIVYLIEAFTDPRDVGIKTTVDPIPFYHQLQKQFDSGLVYSPVIGGRSANAELELLTGFSMQFFPPYAIAYNDIPYRKIPSLANELKMLGYYSTAIHVASLGFFNYHQMYRMQGFDEAISLWGRQGVKKDPAGRFPSDSALVDEIIKVSTKHDKFFIFAFPNSTHGPWDYSVYDDSAIDLNLDTPLNFEIGEKELKTYINSLNTADLAIEKMINHFSSVDKKVAILIMGDHQPGLSEYREQNMLNNFQGVFDFSTRKQMKRGFRRLNRRDPLLTFDIMHTVPYVLWTNYPVKTSVTYQQGMNSLILKVFDALGVIPKSKFYHFLKKYSESISFKSLLTYIYYDSKDLTAEERMWHKYYELIQYDLLFGKQYSNLQDT